MDTFSRETMFLDPWYVTGFIDGVGSFTYSRSGRQIGLYFAAKASPGERPLIEMLRAHFGGIGKLYDVREKRSGERSGWLKTAVYFRVTRNEELLKVMDHFDHYPLQSGKAKAYAIWREMVVLKSAFRKPDREKLETLSRQLSACFH